MADIHLSLRTQCDCRSWNYTDKAPKQHQKICWIIETLLALQKQPTLYMYTCLSDVLRRKKLSVYVHFNALINSQFSNTVKRRGWNLQNKWAVYIFTYNKLCLIINILCSTAKKFTLRSTLMEQTGTVLDGKKLTNHWVSSC